MCKFHVHLTTFSMSEKKHFERTSYLVLSSVVLDRRTGYIMNTLSPLIVVRSAAPRTTDSRGRPIRAVILSSHYVLGLSLLRCPSVVHWIMTFMSSGSHRDVPGTSGQSRIEKVGEGIPLLSSSIPLPVPLRLSFHP